MPEVILDYCFGNAMPIFAYRYRVCGKQFETLARSGETPVSTDLDQQLSLVATPNTGRDADTEMNAGNAGLESYECGKSVCPALGLG
jgi:hypothetical protein